MWFIQNKKNSADRHYILTEEEYDIGRKGTRILIENDSSISRKHAVLNLSFPEGSVTNPTKKAVLTLTDFGSKYSTSVNSKVIAASRPIILNDGDIIMFGKLDSIWKVVNEPVVITTSCIPTTDKQALKTHLRKIGGHMVNEWTPSCQYLVMNSIMVTIKTVCALVALKPIVRPSFLEDLVEKLNGNEKPPDPRQFIPAIGEASLNNENVSFQPNERRKSLFIGKTFYFFDDGQKIKVEAGLLMAQAKVISCNPEDFKDLDLLAESDVCVMNFGESRRSQSQHSARHIFSFLKKKKKRLILESEIGLAVVHCSTSKYCNPDFDIGPMLFGGCTKLKSQSMSEQTIMASETQSQTLADTPMSRKRKQEYFAEKSKENKITKTNFDAKINQSVNVEEGKNLKSDASPESCFKKPRNETSSDSNHTTVDQKSIQCDERRNAMKDVCSKSRGNASDATRREESTLKRQRSEDDDFGKTYKKAKDQSVTLKEIQDVPDHGYDIKDEFVDDQDLAIDNRFAEMNDDGWLKAKVHCISNTRSFKPTAQQVSSSVKSEDNENDDGLPRGVVKFKFVSLVREINDEGDSRPYSSNLKNFKKFKKVHSLNSDRCVVNSSNMSSAYTGRAECINELNQVFPQQSQDDEEDDRFNWDRPVTNNLNRRR